MWRWPHSAPPSNPRSGGNGQLVEICGEAGVGKSRLVQALLAEADLPSYLIRCDEYETLTPYWPFRDLFTSALRLPAGHRNAAALRDAVADRVPTLLPWLPMVAKILDVDVASTAEVDAVDDRFRQGKSQEIAAQCLAAVLPDRMVLVFEDVHLMDDASAGLLDRLCAEAIGRSWVIIVTKREVPEASCRSARRYHTSRAPGRRRRDATGEDDGRHRADAPLRHRHGGPTGGWKSAVPTSPAAGIDGRRHRRRAARHRRGPDHEPTRQSARARAHGAALRLRAGNALRALRAAHPPRQSRIADNHRLDAAYGGVHPAAWGRVSLRPSTGSGYGVRNAPIPHPAHLARHCRGPARSSSGGSG